MSVFVDTSALFAFVDAGDDNHAAARAVFERLGRSDELVTHQYVAVETLALARRRLDPSAVRAIANDLLPFLTTLAVDEATHAAAVGALLAALPTRLSLVDLVSFQVMRDQSIAAAFAFDRDFERAGFRTVP